MALGTEIALIKALGGGASLPSVTSADAGKVLAVNNSGVWGAQTPASGGGVLVVNAAEDETTYKFVLDKTWQEIHDAFLTGTVRIIALNSVFNVTRIYSSYGQSTFVIECVINGKNGVSIYVYEASSANGYPSEQ